MEAVEAGAADPERGDIAGVVEAVLDAEVAEDAEGGAAVIAGEEVGDGGLAIGEGVEDGGAVRDGLVAGDGDAAAQAACGGDDALVAHGVAPPGGDAGDGRVGQRPLRFSISLSMSWDFFM